MRTRRHRDYSLNPGEEPIDIKKGYRLAADLLTEARKQGIRGGIGGGLAMAVHGYIRATKDVDLILDGIPEGIDMTVIRPVSFGGQITKVDGVSVDWIVRDDERAHLYDMALDYTVRKALKGQEKTWVIYAEWLVLMKALTHRTKDELDVIWLLQQPRKVNRKRVEEYVRDILGKNAFIWMDIMEDFFVEADIRKQMEKGRGK
jgi:hypothetical protein